MYSPATRLLTVLDVLQTRPGWTASELAKRLQVNTRSIRRYITTLQDLGIPVVAERGRYGGYRLRPGFKLPPLMLNDDEALAVTLGLLAAQRFGLASVVPAVEGTLAKIERVLPQTIRDQAQAIQEAMLDLPARHCVAPKQTTADHLPDLYYVEALLETTLERVRWSIPPAFATLEERSDGVLLRAYDCDLEYMARFLLVLGCPFHVQRPHELLDVLEKLAHGILSAVQCNRLVLRN